MSENPELLGLLDKIRETHKKKNSDYADPDNADYYSNFEYAALVADKFTNPVDRVFATLIAVKMARLQELTKPGRKANNESVEDTRLDLATYCCIWTAYHQTQQLRARTWKRPRANRNSRGSARVRGESSTQAIRGSERTITRLDSKVGGSEPGPAVDNERSKVPASGE
jgi:hypothetical protein